MEQHVHVERKFIAERLRAARLAAKMAQQEVAGGHFSKSYLSAIERGKMTPSIQALVVLADRLNLPLAFFLGEMEFDLTALAEPHTEAALSPPDQAQAKKEEAAHLLLREAEQAWAATAVALLQAAAYLSPHVRHLALAKLASLHLAQGALDEAQALIEEGRAAARESGTAPAEGHVVLVLAQVKERQGDAAGRAGV